MSLLTGANLQTLDYAFCGEPAAYVAAKSAVVTTGLDMAFKGEPFGYTPSAGGGGGPGPGGSAQAQYIIAT